MSLFLSNIVDSNVENDPTEINTKVNKLTKSLKRLLEDAEHIRNLPLVVPLVGEMRTSERKKNFGTYPESMKRKEIDLSISPEIVTKCDSIIVKQFGKKENGINNQHNQMYFLLRMNHLKQ